MKGRGAGGHRGTERSPGEFSPGEGRMGLRPSKKGEPLLDLHLLFLVVEFYLFNYPWILKA